MNKEKHQPSPVYSSKEQYSSFLRSNSERRSAEQAVRIVLHHDHLPPLAFAALNNRNVDEHSFLVARAATISGDLTQLKKLILKNLLLSNASDHFGRSLLIYAALSGQTDCALWLISKEGGMANIGTKDRDGMTALHWAVHKGHYRTLKGLLKKSSNGDPLMADEEGATCLHLAVKQQSTKCLEVIIDYLIKKDDVVAIVAVKDNGGRSALHWAAAAGRLPELMKLVKDKVKITFEECDNEGRTPLMWSVLSDSATLQSLELITQRVPLSVRAQDNNGYTPLHFSVMVDNIGAIEHFLTCKLTNPNIGDYDGRTSLHWAGLLGRPGVATLLIKAKIDILRKDAYGATALHYAAQNNYVETLKTMLRHCSVDPLDDEGRSCFMWAAASGSIDTLVTAMNLLKSIDIEQTDRFGATALHLAAQNGQDASVKFLLDRGWSTDALDDEGHTPLLSAAEHGHASALQCFLKSGAAVWQRDANGRTALHWAALGGHAYVCQILIKQGVSVDAVDVGGRTAVHCAAFGGFVGCLSVLLQSGAHPCIQDNQGMIALHLSASEGHFDICKRLVDSGSLINAIYNNDADDCRLTPYDLAVENKREQIIDYLLENGAMSYERLIDVAATKIQAFYRGYRVRMAWKKAKDIGTISPLQNFTNFRFSKKKPSSY